MAAYSILSFNFFQALLQSGSILSIDQLNQVLTNLSGVQDVGDISTVVTQFWDKHVPSDVQRHHVILLLDKVTMFL